MSETISESNPLERQISVARNFILDRVEGIEPIKDLGYSSGDFFVRKADSILLANGGSLSCQAETATVDDEIDASLPETLAISYVSGNGHYNLYLDGNGTVGFMKTLLGKDIYEEYEVPREAAYESTEFAETLAAITNAIEVELPRELPPFVHRNLSSSLIEVAPESAETSTATLDLGFANLPVSNEDAALIDRTHNLFGVFDGVGDKRSGPGDVAARLAAESVKEFMMDMSDEDAETTRQQLVQALEYAAANNTTWSVNGMQIGGTTATIAKVIGEPGAQKLVWASVGDTRIYLKNGPEAALQQITEDEGEGNLLFNMIGGGFTGVKQSGAVDLADGARAFLTSDGITGDSGDSVMPLDEFNSLISQTNSAQEAVESLINGARKKDDRTAISIYT